MEEALAARRASRTRVEGAMNVVDVAIDARTGANIRGSSIAALMWEAGGGDRFLETFRDAWLEVGTPCPFWALVASLDSSQQAQAS